MERLVGIDGKGNYIYENDKTMITNYEEKYNNIIDTLQSLINNGEKQGHIIIRIEDIKNAIPELAESEDEKIKREFCKDIWTFIPNEKAHKYITWLEKQDEKKPKWSIEDKTIIEDIIGYFQSERDLTTDEEYISELDQYCELLQRVEEYFE